MKKLSILIPTIPGRVDQWNNLLESIFIQSGLDRTMGKVQWKDGYWMNYWRSETVSIEVLSCYDERGLTIGEKRNILLAEATGEYMSFIDDDDRVSEDYIKLIMEGIDKGVDCCSLVGEITFDGKNPQKFIHYLGCPSWFEKDNIFHRGINHLNCVKTEIARQIVFAPKNHGEDYDYSMAINASGLLKTQHEILNTIYYYDYISNK